MMEILLLLAGLAISVSTHDVLNLFFLLIDLFVKAFELSHPPVQRGQVIIYFENGHQGIMEAAGFIEPSVDFFDGVGFGAVGGVVPL